MSARRSPTVITWLGHATVVVETDDTRLITDPVLGPRIGPLVRVAPSPGPGAAGRIDGVLISHLHADHTDVRSLRSVGSAVPVLVPSGAGRWLRAKGLDDVRELASGQEEEIGTLGVRVTPAEHDGRRRPFGPTAATAGYVVTGSTTTYFAGDTDLFGGMEELRGQIDIALLPVSGWGPTLGPGHLDPGRAAEAVGIIEPALAIPIHWGTFAVPGLSRRAGDPAAPARRFQELCRQAAPAVEVRIMAPGAATVVE